MAARHRLPLALIAAGMSEGQAPAAGLQFRSVSHFRIRPAGRARLLLLVRLRWVINLDEPSVRALVHAERFTAHATAVRRQHPDNAICLAGNVGGGPGQGGDLLGDRVRIHVQGDVALVAEVTAPAVADLGLHDGVEVWATVKATELTTYPA